MSSKPSPPEKTWVLTLGAFCGLDHWAGRDEVDPEKQAGGLFFLALFILDVLFCSLPIRHGGFKVLRSFYIKAI